MLQLSTGKKGIFAVSHICIEVAGSVGSITIDRLGRMNSLDVETARDFRKAGLQLARDEKIRVVVLNGGDGVFCSGADLKYIRDGGDEGLGYLSPGARPVPGGFGESFKQILEYIHSTISEIRRAPKPFIAAVDGVAAAGGLGIAMACDLVFASERASFEWAYSKTGLTGAESSTFFLPKLLGYRRAMGMLLLNPRIDARRALELGLVNDVLPTATFDNEILRIAERIADGPTEAYGVAKALMNESIGGDRLDYHLDRELELLAHGANGKPFAEGLSAFFGKRAPRFHDA